MTWSGKSAASARTTVGASPPAEIRRISGFGNAAYDAWRWEHIDGVSYTSGGEPYYQYTFVEYGQDGTASTPSQTCDACGIRYYLDTKTWTAEGKGASEITNPLSAERLGDGRTIVFYGSSGNDENPHSKIIDPFYPDPAAPIGDFTTSGDVLALANAIPTGNQQFALSFWINVQQMSGFSYLGQTFLCGTTWQSGKGWALSLQDDTQDKLSLYVVSSSASNNKADIDLSDWVGSWRHVVVTTGTSGASGSAGVYVDGTRVITVSPETTTHTPTHPSTLYLVNDGVEYAAQKPSAYLHDVRYFSRALAGAEVRAVMYDSPLGPEKYLEEIPLTNPSGYVWAGAIEFQRLENNALYYIYDSQSFSAIKYDLSTRLWSDGYTGSGSNHPSTVTHDTVTGVVDAKGAGFDLYQFVDPYKSVAGGIFVGTPLSGSGSSGSSAPALPPAFGGPNLVSAIPDARGAQRHEELRRRVPLNGHQGSGLCPQVLRHHEQPRALRPGESEPRPRHLRSRGAERQIRRGHRHREGRGGRTRRGRVVGNRHFHGFRQLPGERSGCPPRHFPTSPGRRTSI